MISSIRPDPMPQLPEDILYIICSYLKDDPVTLHALVLTSKCFHMAIPLLYDVQRLEASSRPWAEDKPKRLIRCSRFWRTILDTDKGTTCNYASFLRVFDVLDLEWLLETIMKDKAAKKILFDGHPALTKMQNYTHRDIPALVNQIAQEVLPHCKNVVEISREPLDRFLDTRSLTFAEWLKYLTKLQTLRVFDGSTLTQPVRAVLNKYCPALKDFDVYLFKDVDDPDTLIEAFLTEVSRPYEACVLRTCSVGDKTFNTLGENHAESLKILELWSYKVRDAKHDWGALGACHKLHSISLIDFDMPENKRNLWYPDFDKFFSSIFPNLQKLVLEGVSYSLAFSSMQLLQSRNLKQLWLKLDKDENVILPENRDEAFTIIEDFSTGLSLQADLVDLMLVVAIPEELARHAADCFTNAISVLPNLRHLHLGSSGGPCGFFSDSHVHELCRVSSLESIKLASFTMSDNGFAAFENLGNLTTLESMLPCQVSDQVVLELVQNTSLENVLFVANMHEDFRETIDLILTSRGGKFTNFEPYVPRGDYAQDSDSDEDDDYEP